MVWNMSNKYPNREVTLKFTIALGRSRERQKWRSSCQRLNAMKMSEHCHCLQKVSSNKGIFLVLMLVGNAKLYMVKEISCNLMRFKIIREGLAPTCLMEGSCSVFCREIVGYPLNLAQGTITPLDVSVASMVCWAHVLPPQSLCIIILVEAQVTLS